MSLLPHAILIIGTTAFTGCDRVETTSSPQNRELIAVAEEQDVRLAIHAESLQAEAGEPIELVVTIEAPPRQRAELVLPNDDRLGDFDILRIEDALEESTGLNVAQRQRILVSTLASGEIDLPSIEAHYGSDSVLRTEPTRFTIQSMIEGDFDPSSFADIRPAVDDSLDTEREDWVGAALVTGGITLLALVAIALTMAARRKIRPRIPHEWALGELERIEAEGPPIEGATTERYQRIETVLRWYVAFQFDIDAPDRTSNELIQAALDHEDINDDARLLLERIVRESDRAKFAGGSVSVSECSTALGTARMFVKQTIVTDKEESA